MKRNFYILLFAIVLYVGVFLCHDAIFIEKDHLYNNPKTTTFLSKSNEATDATSTYVSTDHKCPFCDGFINDADVQEIIHINLFKAKIYKTYVPSYITSLLIGNPTRAPPGI